MQFRDAPIIRSICFLIGERKCDSIYVNEFGSVYGFRNYGIKSVDSDECIRKLDSFDISEEDIYLDGLQAIGLDYHSDGIVWFHPLIESLIPSIDIVVQKIIQEEYKNMEHVIIELMADYQGIRHNRVNNALAMGRGYMLPNYLKYLTFE